MPTTVRQAQLEDRDAIWQFVREAYGPLARFMVPERWTWQYQANPLARDPAGGLPLWIALDGGRIIGQLCAIPVQLQVRGTVLPAAWGADFYVLPGSDPRAAYRLSKAIAQHYGIFLALTMEDATRRIQRALHARELAPVPTFAKPVRLNPGSLRRIVNRLTTTRPRLRRVSRFGLDALHADRIACALVNPAFALHDRLAALRARRTRDEKGAESGVVVSEVRRFDDDVATLMTSRHGEFDVAVRRDARYLNWRFIENTQLAYRCFVARRDGELEGYMVLRRTEPCEMDLGVIVDLYAREGRSGTLRALIRTAEAHFGRAVAALVCATSLESQKRVLWRAGFSTIHTTVPTCLCVDPELSARVDAGPDRWFFTRGDHDWDQIRPVDEPAESSGEPGRTGAQR